MSAIIQINHLKKSFGNNEVLKDVSLAVKKVKLSRLSVLLAQVNPPFYAVSTYLKNQPMAKFFIKVKMS